MIIASVPLVHWYQGMGIDVCSWLPVLTATALLNRHVGENSRYDGNQKARHPENDCYEDFC